MIDLGRAADVLRARAHGSVTPGGSIAPLTSYRLGGPAGILFEPASDDDLLALSEAVKASGAPVLVVGRGSNMLVSDRGYPGIVVKLGARFRWARANGETIEAGAAMPLPSLAMLAAQNNLAGFEFAVAIPASLGGAVRMNAGAHGHEMREVVGDIELFSIGSGRIERIGVEAAGFAYRSSAVPGDAIVTGATLRLRAGEPASITAHMNEAKEWRRETQPVNLPNGGSVFKNPPGDHAARLVETVCGKGMSVGGARISEVHANFIVAEAGARASDVHALIRRAQRMVREATGIELEPELKLIGDFEEVEA